MDLEVYIGVSYLTAKTLGFINFKTDAYSYQAYLMLGDKCLFNCAFCSQARDSKTASLFLSRVKWPKFKLDEVLKALKKAEVDNKIKKVCFQVVSFKDYFNVFKKILRIFKEELTIPISASIHINNVNDAKELFDLGINKIGIALDCISKEKYKEIKGGNFEKDKELLFNLSKLYPSRISTHIIYGIGENDRELLNFYLECLKYNIDFALFNFTPIKGTKYEKKEKIDHFNYRKIQLALSIIDYMFYSYKKVDSENFDLESIRDNDILNIFYFDDNDNFTGFYKNQFFNNRDSFYNFLMSLNSIKSGEFLMTRGCKYCNRPYYNEKPDGFIYNYFKKPDKKEINFWLDKYVNFLKIISKD